MAPQPLSSSKVELHESEITKPQPLRIIKRSQTISGIPISRGAFGGRGSSGSSCESKGSPPFWADRPLTVRKKRQGRGSIMGLRSENSGSEYSNRNNTLADLVKDYHTLSDMMDDQEVTPKAKQKTPRTPRTISAGDFLKYELYRPTADIEADRYSARGQRQPKMYDQTQNFRIPPSPTCPPPPVPYRRHSKSKNFFLRAIGVRNNEEPPKHIRRAGSTSSRHTLIRNISREKRVDDDPLCASFTYSPAQESFDIADVGINSRIYSQNTTSTPSPGSSPPSAGHPGAFVLCPQITVTPEVVSVETGACALWVAVLITGALQRADGYKTDGSFSQSYNGELLDYASYGRLHNMRIELMPGPGCRLTDLVEDLHTVTAMQAGGSRLIVAKIVLSKSTSTLRQKDTTADNLMAELENDLGHTLTPFLSVRLTYRHSGFPQLKGAPLVAQGLGCHFTNLQTEATAVIKRHNPQSAWSPRTSQTMDLPLIANPVIDLIETHLPPDQARDALRRLATERAPIPLAKRFQHLEGSSEETIKPSNVVSKTIPTVSTTPVQAIPKASDFAHHINMTSSPLTAIALAHTGREQTEGVDPARKIWTEMRRNSRIGRSRHHRASISADHYYSFEDDCSPSRIGSGEVSSSLTNSDGSPPTAFEQERSRIMEMALRNKRSVGADTLRSIAPSVLSGGGGVGGGEKKGINGLGLGVGRSWGWAHSWW